MSLSLEDEIMREIGFAQHYSWHNGSGGCRWTRLEAAKKLPGAILAHANRGDAIIRPFEPLIAIVQMVAEEGEDPRSGSYVLTNTWQAAANVIRAHMEAAATPGHQRQAYLKETADYLSRRFPSLDPFGAQYRRQEAKLKASRGR